MSGGLACRNRSHEWVVTARECNYSAFNGYRRTPSAYSEVWCLDCSHGGIWRTKAKFVARLRDMRVEDAHKERERKERKRRRQQRTKEA